MKQTQDDEWKEILLSEPSYRRLSADTRREIYREFLIVVNRWWARYIPEATMTEDENVTDIQSAFSATRFRYCSVEYLCVAPIYATIATFASGLDFTRIRRRVMPRNKLTIKPADEPRLGDLSFVSQHGFCVEIILQKKFLMEFASRLESWGERGSWDTLGTNWQLRYKWTGIYSCFVLLLLLHEEFRMEFCLENWVIKYKWIEIYIIVSFVLYPLRRLSVGYGSYLKFW